MGNGVYQGGSTISKEPMWIITTVDRPADKIEIQKLPVDQIPKDSLEQLQLLPSEGWSQESLDQRVEVGDWTMVPLKRIFQNPNKHLSDPLMLQLQHGRGRTATSCTGRPHRSI